MGAEDRRASDHEWREALATQLSRIETTQDAHGIKLDELKIQVNGRFKKLEDTVFGNEEKGMIGLSEKIRGLDGKKAIAIALIVWVATVLGNYTVKKVMENVPVARASAMEVR